MGSKWVIMYFRQTRARVRLDISVIIVRGVSWTLREYTICSGMCEADSIICLIEALPMARSNRQPVIILVLLCLIKDDGSSQTGCPLPVRVPAGFSCMDNAQDENDNVPAILFWCNRLRLYNTCGRMG